MIWYITATVAFVRIYTKLKKNAKSSKIHIVQKHAHFDTIFYIFRVFQISSGKKGKRKVQGVPQSQTAALPRNQEEKETDKTKQAQIEQTYEKHQD